MRFRISKIYRITLLTSSGEGETKQPNFGFKRDACAKANRRIVSPSRAGHVLHVADIAESVKIGIASQ